MNFVAVVEQQVGRRVLDADPMTYLLFSFSFETSGEKSESPEAITKQLM